MFMEMFCDFLQLDFCKSFLPYYNFYLHSYGQLLFLFYLCTGDKVGCFMLSEPGNGSDAGAASTLAVMQVKINNYYYYLNVLLFWLYSRKCTSSSVLQVALF